MTEPKAILKNSSRILLIDWPNPTVPRRLVNAGFSVFCYSPDQFSIAQIVREYPNDVNQKNIFPPSNIQDGYLVLRQIDSSPGSIDIVNIYRPEEEHADIIANHVIPLGAKVIWLQPPVMSENTRLLAEKNNLVLIEGVDIAEAASG
jgi:hypothetical protein